jgi:hypothetical protein
LYELAVENSMNLSESSALKIGKTGNSSQTNSDQDDGIVNLYTTELGSKMSFMHWPLCMLFFLDYEQQEQFLPINGFANISIKSTCLYDCCSCIFVDSNFNIPLRAIISRYIIVGDNSSSSSTLLMSNLRQTSNGSDRSYFSQPGSGSGSGSSNNSGSSNIICSGSRHSSMILVVLAVIAIVISSSAVVESSSDNSSSSSSSSDVCSS